MDNLWMILAFAMAAYSIVANDSIQTLGTFLTSNAKRPWWMMWIWISGIMIVTVMWGWFSHGGDPAFGRLNQKGIEFPSSIPWILVIPPLILLLLTRIGIPLSTTFLILTAFSSITVYQQGGDSKTSSELLVKMLQKSFSGYVLAFIIGFSVYLMISGWFERKIYKDRKSKQVHPYWMVIQWLSTGFLWSMWLVQDLANVFVYLPRKLEWWGISSALLGMVLLQGALIRSRGGKIQKVVRAKTNIKDVRSATLVDLFYGLILLFFKVDYIPKLFAKLGLDVPWPEKLPMSTTWVFLGLLAGREIGIAIRLRHRSNKKVSRIIFTDAGKAFVGIAVSLVVAFGLPLLAKAIGIEPDKTASSPTETPEENVEANNSPASDEEPADSGPNP